MPFRINSVYENLMNITSSKSVRQPGSLEIHWMVSWGFFYGASIGKIDACGAGGAIFLSDDHYFSNRLGLGQGSNNWTALRALAALLMQRKRIWWTSKRLVILKLPLMRWMVGLLFETYFFCWFWSRSDSWKIGFIIFLLQTYTGYITTSLTDSPSKVLLLLKVQCHWPNSGKVRCTHRHQALPLVNDAAISGLRWCCVWWFWSYTCFSFSVIFNDFIDL